MDSIPFKGLLYERSKSVFGFLKSDDDSNVKIRTGAKGGVCLRVCVSWVERMRYPLTQFQSAKWQPPMAKMVKLP